ncbi:MAG: dTMP kinase [Bacteroidota bacterium]
MLITFEGIDGSGKSTQARRLAAALRQKGTPVREVREPGGAVLPERIRALLLDPALAIADRAELLLFSAARAQLVDEVVRPALEVGEVVLADRFYDSTTAYQGGGRGLAGEAWLDRFHEWVTGGLVPSRTYLVDVPLEVAAGRRAGQAADRMEASGKTFYTRVRMAYLALAARHPERVMILDGTLAPDVLHTRILTDVQALALKSRLLS